MRRRAVAPVLVAVLVAAGCGTSDVSTPPPALVTTTSAAEVGDDPTGPDAIASPPADPPSTSRAPERMPATLDQVDCPEELLRRDGVELACGVATVPLDPDDPTAGTTRITLATMAGTDDGLTTPLAVLQGGPGGASSTLASWFPRRPFTQVFVDQRGTGFQGPDLDCPEILEVLPDVVARASVDGVDLALEAYGRCAERLEGEAVFDHIDSAVHAADVVAVMDALGYGTWVLYGVSYGTTIALEVLREPPDAVAGVVLDGVYPPELDVDAGLAFSATRVIDELDRVCGADDACRTLVPGGSVRATLEEVVAALDREPMIVSVRGREVGLPADVDVVLDGARVAELTFLVLYQESLSRFLPAVLAGLERRDPESARWLAGTGTRLLVASQAANDEGTYFAVQCRDRLPFTDGPGRPTDPFAAAVTALTLDDACAAWDPPAADPAADDPVRSDVPTLLLSGGLDPITPHDFALDVAARLERGTAVEQSGRGHGVWYGDDCIGSIVLGFLVAPGDPVDVSCAAEGVGIEWARP